jgi:hypothetical protein
VIESGLVGSTVGGVPREQKMLKGHLASPSPRTRSYLRLIDSCITPLKAQGPSRTFNESKEEEAPRPPRLEQGPKPLNPSFSYNKYTGDIRLWVGSLEENILFFCALPELSPLHTQHPKPHTPPPTNQMVAFTGVHRS